MPTLTERHEQRGRIVTEARTALDEINANTDDSRVAELEQRHDTIMAQLDKLDKEIAREERVARAEQQLEERAGRNRPNGGNIEVPGEGGGGEERSAEQLQTEYRDAFGAFLRSGCDISAMDNEQRGLLRRAFNEVRTQTAGTPAAGGYTVPREMATEIVRVMKDWGPMYDGDIVTDLVTGSGNEFDIPTNDDTANGAGQHTEGGTPADDNSGDVAFGQKGLNAYIDITPWVKVSYELMQDSQFDIVTFVAGLLGERLGRQSNVRLTVGTNVGQPHGVVTASPMGKEAAAAAALASDELISLQHSVRAPYRRSPKCRWMFADTTLEVIRKMKNGDGNYLWQMGDIRVGAPDLLLSKPYSINDDVPAIGANAKPILFGDFSRYWVRKVGSPLIGTVRERFWPNIGLAGLARYDGELVDPNAIKHLKMAAA